MSRQYCRCRQKGVTRRVLQIRWLLPSLAQHHPRTAPWDKSSQRCFRIHHAGVEPWSPPAIIDFSKRRSKIAKLEVRTARTDSQFERYTLEPSKILSEVWSVCTAADPPTSLQINLPSMSSSPIGLRSTT